MLTVGSLFSGIGGLDLGLERAGMNVVWQVENDDYCKQVLEKHWPNVQRFDDVRCVGACELVSVDVICGGFPCQPVSLAGKRRGQDDERWLWPEFARLIRELRPRYAIMENVPGLLVRGMGDVLGDLAEAGYDAEWDCISACAVGAPHIRNRVFILAYPNRHEQGRCGVSRREAKERVASSGHGEIALALADASIDGRIARRASDASKGSQRGRSHRSGIRGVFSNADRAGLERERIRWSVADGGWWTFEPDVGRVAHGVPARMHRLRGLGNAVVPQVAEWIGRRIIRCLNDET